MIQPSLAGLVPLVQDNPALGSAKRRTVLGYSHPSLRDSCGPLNLDWNNA